MKGDVVGCSGAVSCFDDNRSASRVCREIGVGGVGGSPHGAKRAAGLGKPNDWSDVASMDASRRPRGSRMDATGSVPGIRNR